MSSQPSRGSTAQKRGHGSSTSKPKVKPLKPGVDFQFCPVHFRADDFCPNDTYGVVSSKWLYTDHTGITWAVYPKQGGMEAANKLLRKHPEAFTPGEVERNKTVWMFALVSHPKQKFVGELSCLSSQFHVKYFNWYDSRLSSVIVV